MTPSTRSVVLVAVLATAGCARDPRADARAFAARADNYAARGEFSKALIEYRNAIDRDAGVASTYYRMGLVYERTGDPDRALSAFVRAGQLDSTLVDAHLRASQALVTRGRYVDARRLADAVISLEPRNATAVAVAAAAAAGLGNTAQAERLLKEALVLQPRFALAHRLFGNVLLQRGRVQEARAALQAAVVEDDQSAAAWADLGQACWALGDLRAAEAAFQRALGADPHSADVHRRLTAFYVGTGRTREAEPHLRELADASGEARIVLADYYMAAARLDDAARELDRVTDAHLANVVRLRKAVLAYRRDDKAGAYRQLETMIADRTTAADATLVKSDLLLQDQDVDGALREAQHAVALRSGWPEASYMMAVIQLIRGDAAEATRWLQRARADGADGPAIDRSAGVAANNLAWSYAENGRLPEALDLARRAQRTLGDRPQVLHTLGWIYMRQGDYARAIAWLRRACAAAPGNARYREDLARAYAQATGGNIRPLSVR